MKDSKTEKNEKRSYYLPDKLMKTFKTWCKPGKDYSTKVAGAIYLYMMFNANAREVCEKLAHADSIEISSKEFRSLLKDEMDKIEGKLLARDILSAVEAREAGHKRKKPRNPSKSA